VLITIQMHGMQVSIEMTVRYILVYHKCLSVHSKVDLISKTIL